MVCDPTQTVNLSPIATKLSAFATIASGALRWPWREKDDEHDCVEHSNRGGAFARTISCAARNCNFLQGLAAGSGSAYATEQPRSGGCRKARRPGGLRRYRQGRAELGELSRHRKFTPRPGQR